MKANELNTKDFMTEDWVEVVSNDHLKYVQIAEIYQSSILTKESEFESEEVSIDNIKPIPLTPEILEKNGFVYESKDELFKDIYPRISMLYAQYRLVENGYINYGEMSEIKYVHQLQHALKLCGIEKTIEL